MDNELIKKYNEGRCTEEEKALVESWYLVQSQRNKETLANAEVAADQAEVYNRIIQPKVRPMWPWIAAAASIAIIIGSYFVLQPIKTTTRQNFEAVLPSTTGITITVAGQQPINIQYRHHGQVAGNIVQNDSLLTYSAGDDKMQTATNNSGHRINLQLSDGTLVALDVQSSLTYPGAFHGKLRKVTLTGQGYFDVKHDANQPFEVEAGGMVTRDIGTAFNINAYEKTQATLISGSIKVNDIFLQPGQQTDGVLIHEVNLEEVTAWLQDRLIFHHERLENIMKSVSRIYQVSVVWNDESSKELTFGGSVSRAKKLANVLNFMRETGKVDFRVDGRTVYVMKPNQKTK